MDLIYLFIFSFSFPLNKGQVIKMYAHRACIISKLVSRLVIFDIARIKLLHTEFF